MLRFLIFLVAALQPGLPPTDLDRVGPGVEAPDFSLADASGEMVRLSEFRGHKRVVLVFYRGHW